MKKSVASSIYILFLLGPLLFGRPVHAAFMSGNAGGTALDTQIISQWQKYDGHVIKDLNFVGLLRTKGEAIRWIIKSLEGEKFDSRQLAQDVQAIYNTGDLYDIHTRVFPDPQDPGEVQLVIEVHDKWTLMPVFGAQGGGGALTYGGGLYDSNLFGYFINAQALAYNYNGVVSYDVNFADEFIAGTETMGMLDWSYNVNPTIIHNIDGTTAGQFSWGRQQEEVMWGTHLPGPVRIMVSGDVFIDSILDDKGVNAFVYEGTQYRLHPRVIFGRANINDYLEEGYELTIHPMAANFFGPVTPYQGLDVTYKQVEIVDGTSNIAYRVQVGGMTPSPPPYEYEVGGYYNLRGFIDSRQVGPYFFVANFEYRPLLFTYRFKIFGVDLMAAQACLFTDAGSAWGDTTLTGDQGTNHVNVLWSAGAGVRANFLHFAGAILRLDVARTLRPDEGWGISFGVGQLF